MQLGFVFSVLCPTFPFLHYFLSFLVLPLSLFRCSFCLSVTGYYETQFDGNTGSWKVEGSGYKKWKVEDLWRDPGPKGDHTTGKGNESFTIHKSYILATIFHIYIQVYSFIGWWINSFIPVSILNFILEYILAFVQSCYLFILWSVHSFIHFFIPYSSIHSSIHSFIHSVNSFIH